MTAIALPQVEGQYTPEEAAAWQRAQLLETNRATDPEIASQVLTAVTSMVTEWSDRMQGLHRRWRGTWKMLAGNTLDKGGPEDVHVPEIYKEMETLIPRIEESILEREPWFRSMPRRRTHRRAAEAIAALIEWQFAQAKVRNQVQPAIRDALVTQAAAFYCFWDNKESFRNIRTVKQTFDKKGVMRRSLKVERKRVIDFSGPRSVLIDPLDFIVDTKATNAQDALYVGHRAWMTVHEIKRIGKQMGWANLDQLEGTGQGTYNTLGPDQSRYGYTRDPTARYNLLQESAGTAQRQDGRPNQIEVVFLYCKLSLDHDETYEEVRLVVAGGKTVLEARENPLDGQYRPYATMRVTKSGHEFYSTGIFDNAIRLNQHLDRLHQIALRGAAVAGNPMVFASEDSDLPDSLYKVRPFQVFKGVGDVKFTTIPGDFLRAMPMMIGMLQRNIEETVGAFRLNMGQDSNGTATEATLSLQEGNRRTRGIIRAVGEGLEQVLDLFYALTRQFSQDDVEFPVLGKRALNLKTTHLTLNPADLLPDVKFDLIGLNSLRTYGLKATGLQAVVNSMAPFIMANPTVVDQPGLIHEVMRELVGPEEADRLVKVPTPIDQLYSQGEENEGLITGTEIEVDEQDDHTQHKRDMLDLFMRARDPKAEMEFSVRKAVIKHWYAHDALEQREKAQEAAMQKRQQAQQAMLPQQAGGEASPETGRSSPQAGGMSDQMSQLAYTPGGQTEGENPGPADSMKYSRTGGAGRTTNQTENSL